VAIEAQLAVLTAGLAVILALESRTAAGATSLSVAAGWGT
jgi:hypothetical protein